VSRVRTFLLGSLFLLSPIFFWPDWGDSVREPKLYLIIALGLLVLVTQLLDPRRAVRMGKNAPRSVLALFAYAVIRNSVSDAPFLAAFRDTVVFLAFLAPALELAENPESRFIENCLLAMTWINLLIGTGQLFGFDPFFMHLDRDVALIPTGFLGHRTMFGPFLAMLFGYHLAGGRYATAALCFLLACSTRSMMSLASLGAVVLAFLVLRRRYRLAFGLLVSGAIASTVAFRFRYDILLFSDKGRFLAWEFTFRDAMDAPVFGHGFHSFSLLFANKYILFMKMKWNQAHQEMLQAFFELGLVGVFFISWMLADFFGAATWREARSPAREGWLLVCVAGMANSLANFPFHVAPLAFFSLCGWVCTVSNRAKIPADA
jgi:hypothetical protein